MLISTLTDDFTTADTAKWAGFDANTQVSGGQLVQQVTSGYLAFITSQNVYSLVGSSADIQLVQRPNVGNGSTEAHFGLELDSSNWLRWIATNNALMAVRRVAGTTTTVVSFTYSATAHQRLRIREAGGTIFWDTHDGTTWTQRGSWVLSGFAVTAVKPLFLAGFWGTEPSPGTVIWDNFNVAPLAVPVSETWTGADGAAWSAQWSETMGTATIQSNRGRLAPAASGTYATARRLRTDVAASSVDMKVEVTFTTATTNEQYAFLYLRHDGTWAINAWDPTQAYALRLVPGLAGTADISMQKYVGGAASLLAGSGDGTETFTGVRAVRFQAVDQGNGTTLVRYKHWLSTDVEPTTWAASYVDASPLPAGTVGLAAVNGGSAVSRPIDFDNLTAAAATPDDTTAPTVPTGVTATANSPTQVTIAWTASTDAVGVASYRVRRGGVDLAGATAVTGTSFVDTTATASTAYSYTVSAVDTAGNRSAESTAAPVTTFAILQGSGTPSAISSATGNGTAVGSNSGAPSASTNATGAGTVIPSVATLTDNFTTKDTGKWTWGAAANAVDGQLRLTRNSNYTGQITSVATYALHGASLTVEWGSVPTSGVYSDAFIGLLLGNNALQFDIESAASGGAQTIAAYIRTNGTWAAAKGKVAYSPVNHRFMRIRESAGTVYWETSPDRVVWSVTHSVLASTVAFSLAGMQPYLGTGDGASEVVVADNVNFTPAVKQGTASFSVNSNTTGAGTLTVMSDAGTGSIAADAAGDGSAFDPETTVLYSNLTGRFLTDSGDPVEGLVVLTPGIRYRVDSTYDRIVKLQPREVRLVNGSFLERIPANGGPFGLYWSWKAEVIQDGSPVRQTLYFVIPMGTETIDIADCTVG